MQENKDIDKKYKHLTKSLTISKYLIYFLIFGIIILQLLNKPKP
jgi:hypothetical protein